MLDEKRRGGLRRGFGYLCGDDVELELLPVVVSLLKCLDLFSESDDRYGAEQKKGECTSVSVHALIRSRSLLKRICKAGT